MPPLCKVIVWTFVLVTVTTAHPCSDDGNLRPPLIPQGARIVETAGALNRSPSHPGWIFEPAPPMPKGTQLIVMPSQGLEEMEDHLTSGQDVTGRFVVTGRVFQWRGENYLLPDVVQLPRSTTTRPPEDVVVIDPASLDVDAGSDDEAWDDDGPGLEEISAITQALNDAVGGVTPSLDQGSHEATPSPSPSIDSVASILSGENRASPVAMSPPPISHAPVLIARRGVLRRDTFGAIVLILDAQETSSMEEPLVLLPSALLDHAHRMASTMSVVTPVEVTGEVITYRSRRFVLPSVISPVVGETTLGLPHPIRPTRAPTKTPSGVISPR